VSSLLLEFVRVREMGWDRWRVLRERRVRKMLMVMFNTDLQINDVGKKNKKAKKA
jgi:hypothetical protein